ncbi:hypothetical protein HBI46_152800 [Parastagonospora nodorum]|nr:hypothetical protein HBH93_066110 [Parastagonospora nodorum]KAH5412171.1 hypothetical protein HBI46_152800 [Parastagonospora nodorum]KAH5675910.1 hypothetical protein HBI21_119130 [Parastagonospora nodorum]
MSENYSYNRLPTVLESHDLDITEANNEETHDPQAVFRPLESQVNLSLSDFEKHDVTDHASLKSFDTHESTSSGSSISKLKNFGARLRRKPLPRYLRGSIKRHAAAEIEPARIGRGVWRDQLLSDRSLRGMAALMSAFAIAMIILVAVFAKNFAQRSNRNTSSVGGEPQSCKTVTRTNTVLLLLINVCATMVLGMSNTYQQLVTSLKVSDLKHALSKFGDSRVGTNSPFSINHKKVGKKRAWASWFLLIITSMPIHFLANSLIGPSYTQELPQQIDFVPDTSFVVDNRTYSSFANSYRGDDPQVSSPLSFPCWSAFRTGVAHYAKATDVLSHGSGEFTSAQKKFDATWNRMEVHYMDSPCVRFKNDTANSDTQLDTLESSYIEKSVNFSPRNLVYEAANCTMASEVYCTLHDRGEAKCRLNVRMSAAFTLMACLVIKATYSECMVNAAESFRQKYSHTCHKHCFNPEESKTGDEIGHCQKCKEWNSSDKFANLPQPAIATKIKRSLISNLGNTALTQMCLLMFCSMLMIAATLTVATIKGAENEYIKSYCKGLAQGDLPPDECKKSEIDRFSEISGGFGGFNRSLELTSLPPDSLANEYISFSVSNGAQFIYSLLYLMLIYNITLISQEYDWGKLEYCRQRLRSTLVSGSSFNQDYLLQLPKKILFPTMMYSVLTHWMLGEALQTQEAIWLEPGRRIEHSKYIITYAAYPLWVATFLILLMTGVCWWAFTYKREGFIPQMFGSIRVLMASTTQLDGFPDNGVQWGDLGEGKKFRHAGLSAEEVLKIVPNELYAGLGDDEGEDKVQLSESGE